MARRDEEPARREVPLVRIFLSSPGDVADERTSARQLIDAELPKLRSLRGRLALELIAWDDPAAQGCCRVVSAKTCRVGQAGGRVRREKNCARMHRARD